MRRIASAPRSGWQEKVEAAGLTWHTGEQAPYWNESAFYEFTAQEADLLADVTHELEVMALKAVQYAIDNRLYSWMGIPEAAVPLIERSWQARTGPARPPEPSRNSPAPAAPGSVVRASFSKARTGLARPPAPSRNSPAPVAPAGVPSLYGRFDLVYDGCHPPKLLEYNADTPTSLLEAAVVQWFWLEETHPASDQFNSIHERLIALWNTLAPLIPARHVDFCAMDDAEDWSTATYLEDTAQQAGLSSTLFPVEEIGWDGTQFVGPDERPLTTVFKLYPWEWMIREEFGKYLEQAPTVWLEPPWKMLLSNKGILPVLWHLYPHHPNLLAAGFQPPPADSDWVKKPLLGREGENVTLRRAGQEIQTGGGYGREGFVYQDAAPIKSFSGMYPVLGSWVIGHEEGACAAGIGIRESDIPITTNTSRFVPHLCG